MEQILFKGDNERNIWDPNFPHPNPFRKAKNADDFKEDDDDPRWVPTKNDTKSAWVPKSIIDDEEAKELFYKCDIRIGTITECKLLEKNNKIYSMMINYGKHVIKGRKYEIERPYFSANME